MTTPTTPSNTAPAQAATAWAQVTIGEFIRQLGARQPTPGGGAACAINGAVGAATIAMSAAYTSGPKYAAVEKEAAALYQQLQSAAQVLIGLAGEDETAYAAVNAVLALPKEPDEARKLRWDKLKKARLAAAQIPLRMVEECGGVLAFALQLKPLCNPSILSDLQAGSEMVLGALHAASVQVRANLEGLKGGDALAQRLTETEKILPALIEEIRRPPPPPGGTTLLAGGTAT